MSDVFITSDEHYGHANIIQYVDRPFQNTDEMRETLIERHNETVPNKQSYVTIHCGDMFWESMDVEDCKRILKRLHGRHAFLWGNHDKVIEQNRELADMFEWVRDVHTIHFNKKLLWLSHYAHRVWPKSHKGSWHVFGHSHQDLPPMGKSFDIGVEGHDYRPWSLEEIAAKIEKLESHHVIPAGKIWKGKSDVIL